MGELIDAIAIRTCLACGQNSTRQLLDLGEQPLANSYRKINDTSPENTYPLTLMLCESCKHCQLSVAVNPSILYENYFYVSNTTTTLMANFKDFAEFLAAKKPKSRVLDIAANDGSFVKILIEKGLRAEGVDPAKNLVDKAQQQGLPLHLGFWNQDLAKEFAGCFDFITAMNVLAHVGDPLNFLEGCHTALKDNGSIYIQTSQAYMINRGEFDTIYHEHHSFFNTQSLQRLAKRAGLYVVGGEYVEIHGTSYRWELKKFEEGSPVHLIEDETARGIYRIETYERFSKIALERAATTFTIVDQARSDGFIISAYGAAAKAHTFFNFAGIYPDIVVDENDLKQQHLSPGSGVLIQDPKILSTIAEPIQHIVSAWNFANEIKSKIDILRPNSKGDYFLQYFPSVQNVAGT
jgi:2-polyprenyl-3-methyl-5-hydroxy-6-metoxy-1,4-benzoquinol methylase